MEIKFSPINNKIYKMLYIYDRDPYPEDIWCNHSNQGTSRGSKPSNRCLYSYEARMYKTWKHNRRAQWK